MQDRPARLGQLEHLLGFDAPETQLLPLRQVAGGIHVSEGFQAFLGAIAAIWIILEVVRMLRQSK